MTYKGRSDEHSSGNTQEATSARICSVGPGTLLGPWTYTFPSNWDSDANAVARATNGLQFGVQSAGFNLPVFLGELREFRDVFGGVLGGFKPSNLDAGGVWYKKTERFLRRLERRPFAEAIKLVAGSDLFVQFAIKPMVGDIQKMLVTGQHIGSQYDRLRSNKPLRTRHTVKDSGSSFYTNLPTTSEHYYTRKVHYDRWVTAWAKFELDLSGLPKSQSGCFLQML